MEGDNKLGPLPQTLQEGHHQAAHIVRVVGGEGVLVLFDGRQSKSTSTETGVIFKINDQETHVAGLDHHRYSFTFGEERSTAVTPLHHHLPAAGNRSDFWEGEF